ncbi:uncharacterized protein LOC144913920 isoform X3 [Branchiostoma floridae x Branchiostoma belcheri]
MPAYCVIKSCEFRSGRKKGMSFCRIPAVITNQGEEAQQLSEERRRLWLAAICIDRDKLTESNLVHGRVCGAHFVSGKAAPPWNRTSVDWVPTLKLTRSKKSEAEERAQERAQERAWRRFKLSKRRRRKAAIAALSNEEKHQSGMQTRPVPTATPSNMQQAVLVTALSAAKHARIPDSAQAAGEELQHGAGDHDIEGDRTPPVGGVLGFSKETTFALLPRMHLEELQSELNRRNIEVKLAGGDRPRGRGDLEHVLREVMTREYEEAEGDESMDVSDTSSTFQHGRSNTSSTFEHGHSNTSSLLEHGSFLEEVSSSEVLSGLNNDQTTTPNIQGPTGKEETPSSRQAADKNVSETPSTDTFLGQVQVKKEPIEQYHVAMTSSSSHTVPPMTGPSTSQIGPTCTRSGMSQPNVTRAQNLAVKIKTEPGAEETTEEEQPESEDLSSEPCVSSPGQLSHELDMVDVSMGEEEEEDKLQSEEPVKAASDDSPQTFPTTSNNRGNFRVAVDRPRKRIRTDMTAHYPTLHQYYQKGMQNCKDLKCRIMIAEVAQVTKLPEINVKNWIHNMNRKAEQEKRGEPPPPKKPKIVLRKRQCSVLSCFKSWYMKGKSGPNVMKDAAKEYRRLQKEDPEFLKKFQEEVEKAKDMPKPSLEELDTGGKKQAARELYKVLEKTVTDLHTCGWDGFVEFYDHSTKKRRSCGTPKGKELLKPSSSNETSAEKRREETEELRERLREQMNKKWRAAVENIPSLRSKRKRFPYGMHSEGKIVVEGLPDGMTYRRPSDFGTPKLKAILKHMDNIVIRVIEEGKEDTSSDSGQVQEPSTSASSPQSDKQDSETPNVAELLSEVSSGLAQAGQNREEVSIDL